MSIKKKRFKYDLNILCVYFCRYLLQTDPGLIKHTDSLNRTALHYAYAYGDLKMVELLVSHKIDKSVSKLF